VNQLDERCDVFGLGAILCVILTGAPPFRGATREEIRRRAMQGDLADAFERLDHCGADGELIALAKACLAPALEERPRDAPAVAAAVETQQAEVQERLRQAELARAAAQARAAEEKAKAAAERRARWLTVGLAAAALLLAAAGGMVAWVVQQQNAEATARQQAADAKARAAMDQVRGKIRPAWEENDVARLTEALADADRA